MTNDARLFTARFPLIIGHRGASSVAPENTLAAFEQAMQDGADGVELTSGWRATASRRHPRRDAATHRAPRRGVATLSSSELQDVDAGRGST